MITQEDRRSQPRDGFSILAAHREALRLVARHGTFEAAKRAAETRMNRLTVSTSRGQQANVIDAFASAEEGA